MTIIGCTVDTLAVLDAQVGAKVPVRDYFWDKQNPAYMAGMAQGRRGILSWKERTNAGIFPAVDFTAGKYDGDFNAFLDDALSLGMIEPVIVTDHETDAKAAAAGGTPDQLDASLLHASQLCRNHRLWKSSSAKLGVCLTGYQLVDRGPLFAAPLADCDVIVLDPYASSATSTVDAEAGPDMDWIAKTYPGKEVQFGEWGIPNNIPNRSQAIAATVAAFNTPRYQQLTAAYYWNGGTCKVMGTPDQAALVAAIKASIAPPPDLQAQLDAALAQLAAATAQHTTDEATIVGLQTTVNHLTGIIAAARTALGG